MYILLSLKNSTVGTDVSSYRRAYEGIFGAPFSQISFGYWEKGYLFLMFLSAQLNISWYGFQTTIYAICITSVGVYIYRFSKDVYLSIYMFIFYNFFIFYISAIRNALALSICLWAIQYINQKGIMPFIKFCLITYLASLFHNSAYIFFAFYFLGRMKINRIHFLKVIIITAILFLLNEKIFQIILEQADYLTPTFSQASINISLIVLILVFVFSWWVNAKNSEIDRNCLMHYIRNNGNAQTLIIQPNQKSNNSENCVPVRYAGNSRRQTDIGMFFPVLIRLQYWSIITQLILTMSSGAIVRLGIYFQIVLITILPNAICMLNVIDKALVRMIIIALLVLYFIYTLAGLNTLNVIPYRFFWE